MIVFDFWRSRFCSCNNRRNCCSAAHFRVGTSFELNLRLLLLDLRRLAGYSKPLGYLVDHFPQLNLAGSDQKSPTFLQTKS